MPETRTRREANFELLRVAAMLMVLLWHALGHGGVLREYAVASPGRLLFSGLRWMSSVAVNVFVLITGYFMVRTPAKVSRAVKLLLQLLTYSLVSLALAVWAFGAKPGLWDIVYAFFPATSWGYWFASDYLALLLLSPALNWALRALDAKKSAAALLALLGAFSLVPTVFPWSRGWLSNGYDIHWFVTLYCAAGFIRLHEDALLRALPFLRGRRAPLAGYLGLTWGCALLEIALGLAGEAFLHWPAGEGWPDYNSAPVFLAAVCLFIFFKNLTVRGERLRAAAVSLGSVCFGAYLLTDHNLVRGPLWDWIALPRRCAQGPVYAVAWTFAAVLALFAAGCLFEAARLRLMAALRLPERLRALDARAERIYAHFFGS